MAAISIEQLRLQYKALACILLLLACLMIKRAAAAENSSCLPSDLQALSSLAAGVLHAVLQDPQSGAGVNMTQSWSSEHDCCSWMGVTCTNTSSAQNNSSAATANHSRVMELSLNFLEFSVSSATILETLCNLSLLSTLKLSGAASPPELSLQIPDCLGHQLSLLQVLQLSSLNLKGPIPSSFSRLHHLQNLDLSSNQLTGPFPPWLGHLSSLNTLDLSSNQLSSPLPDEWQNLHNLSSINLSSGNSLHGTILPEWLFRFPKLSHLRLISMGLQSEDVLCSTRVSMLNNTLQWLDLSGNNITGRDLLECFVLHNFTLGPGVWVNENPLSVSLSEIQLSPTIFSLSLSGCNLTGFLTDNVFDGHELLNLSNNNLVGKIPTKHANLSKVSILDLSKNYFTGFDSYSSFNSLFLIQLSNNLIAGDVSTVLQSLGLPLGNCTSTSNSFWWALVLSYNELVGQIPNSLAECHQYIVGLYLDNNNLTGQIPVNFGNFSNIYILRLNNNHLNGTIPATIIPKVSGLLELSYNKLEGDLKTLFSFSSPSKLVVLSLAHNRISGSIPPFLGNLTPTLIVIDLSYNNLTGNIPQDLSLPSFQSVNLSDINAIINDPVYPLVIKGVERTLEYVWKNFRFLDLSENYLDGVIPSQLGDLSAMQQLNLSHNSFSGPIPEALGKLLMLETLDLSFNNLNGSIPPSLSSLTLLGNFNVSYNEGLVGPIPSGTQLENNESYIGDPLLCGYPVVQKACEAVVDVTNPLNHETMEDHPTTWIDEWVSVPGLCLGIVVGFFGILWVLEGPRITCRSSIH